MSEPAIRFFDLFQAYDAARAAYLRLEARGPGMSDAELARDADYSRLFKAGRSIALIGGCEAIEAAIRAFFPRDPVRSHIARNNLGHWWAGFGTWRVPEPSFGYARI